MGDLEFASPLSGLRLPEVAHPGALESLAVELCAARGRDLDIDASAVRRLGGQGVSLILSAVDAWKADGRSLSFFDPSPEFMSSLELFGVSRAAA